MWYLIMVFWINGNVSVSTIDFKSKENCLQAQNELITKLNNHDEAPAWSMACTKK